MSNAPLRRPLLIGALICTAGLSACSYQHQDTARYGGGAYGSAYGGCHQSCAPQQAYYTPQYYQAPALPQPNLQPYTTTVTTQAEPVNCPANTTPSADGTCLQNPEPVYTPPAYVPPVTTGYIPAPIKPTVYYMPVKK